MKEGEKDNTIYEQNNIEKEIAVILSFFTNYIIHSNQLIHYYLLNIKITIREIITRLDIHRGKPALLLRRISLFARAFDAAACFATEKYGYEGSHSGLLWRCCNDTICRTAVSI